MGNNHTKVNRKKDNRKKSSRKVIKYKRRPKAAAFIFAIILIYVVGFISLYLTKSKVRTYEVDMGALTSDATFTGIALRTEEIVNSGYSGDINYYKKESSRVKVDDTICTVDETGRVSQILSQYTKSDENSLSKQNLASIKSMLNNFRTNYDGSNFYDIYNLKTDLNSAVLQAMNENIIANLDSIISSTGSQNLFQTIKSEKSGVVAYYTDGYENVTTDNLSADLFNKNNYKKIRIFPGISSVSYLSAATGIAWQDAKIISIHGKKDTAETRALVLDAIRHFPKTFLLVSGVEDVRRIGCWIEEEKLTQTRMIAGFQLSYDREKIRELSYEEAKNAKEEGLYTLLLCNENVQKRRLVPGMSDESFLRVVEGEKTVPMTKEEVRALSLCKLGLTEDAVVYDVGSGTGSIAVECATCSPGIRVYAIEQKATAQQLLRRNLEKFHLANVIPVDGKAPEILESLEPPTHVFIGGSSGRLADILHVIWEKNPRTRVVVNAISLETVAQITELAAGKCRQKSYRCRSAEQKPWEPII